MGKRFWFGVFDLLAITVLVAGAGHGILAYQEKQDRRSLRRLRHISRVFHALPLVDAPAPFEDDPDGLARSAVRRLLDPNVSVSAADSAARVLRDLGKDVGLDWGGTCAPEDAARAAPLVAGVRSLGSDGFASALDDAVGDWTRSAGVDSDQVRGAVVFPQRGRDPGPHSIPQNLAASREKGPLRCRITARDADSGAPIDATVVHLLGPPDAKGKRRSRAMGTGPEFRSEPEPSEGDTLVVWAEGHEASDFAWAGGGEVDALLTPCAESATVSLAPECRGLVPSILEPISHLSLVRDGAEHVLTMSRARIAAHGETRIPVPQGAVLTLDFSHAADEVIVPSQVTLRPGGAATLRILSRTDVRLEAPAAVEPAGSPCVAVPDALSPLALSKDEAVAWRRFLGPFRGPIGIAADARGWTAVAVPRIAFHAWTAASDGRRFHFVVPAGETHARPEGEFPLPLVGRPRVGGEGVPDGAVLVPGRLDWPTARALAVRPCRAWGISHFVHAGSDFAGTRLAASDTLTAVHPERGIAWLRFDGRTPPSGEWEKGEITVSSADGGPLVSHVELRAGRDGDAGVAGSTGIEPRGHVDPRGASSIVLRGLPCGDYAVRFDLVERSDDGTPNTKELGSVPVSITSDLPRVEVVEPKRR